MTKAVVVAEVVECPVIPAPEANVVEPEPHVPPKLAGFLKGYGEREEQLHVHVRVLPRDLETQELCIRAQLLTEPDRLAFRSERHLADCLRRPCDHWYSAMLVEVGQFAEDGEGFPLRVYPSLVWLQPLHRCLRAYRKLGDGTFAPRFPELGFAGADWERIGAPFFGGQPLVVIDGEGEGQVVEHGPEVVETVSEDEAQLRWDWRYVADRAVTHLPALLSFHGDRGVGVSLPDWGHGGLEVVEVTTGPYEPIATLIETHGISTDSLGCDRPMRESPLVQPDSGEVHCRTAGCVPADSDAGNLARYGRLID